MPITNPKTKPQREDMFVIELLINNSSFGIWDKKTGGDLDSDEVTYYPGGMVDRIALGGRVLPANITLSRIYDGVEDHARINTMLNAVGKGSCKVTQNPLDVNGNRYGKKVTWSGILKKVLVPNVDSETTAAAMIELEITVFGAVQAL